MKIKHALLLPVSLLSFISLTAQQNSGVGTDTPGSKLEIRADGSDNSKSALNITNNVIIPNSTPPVGKSLFFVRNDGSVGINTTNPAARLHAIGSASTASTYSGLFQNSSGVNTLVIKDDGRVSVGSNYGSAAMDVRAQGLPGGNSYENLFFFTVTDVLPQHSPSDYFAIANSSGTDGSFVPLITAQVNTNSTASPLEFRVQTSSANDVSPFSPMTVFNTSMTGSPNVMAVNRPLLQVRNLGLARFSVSPKGSIYCGAPTANSAIDHSAQLVVASTGNTNATYTAKFKNSATDVMVIRDDGNVGIGINAPSAQLHTTGTVRFASLTGTGNRMVVADASGNISTQAIPTAGTLLPAGTTNQTMRHDGNNWVANSQLQNNGTSIGIGTGANTLSAGDRLAVLGGTIAWGNTALSNEIKADQGGSMELGAKNTAVNPVSAGIPYIDFHYGNGIAEDFNARIINDGDNIISLYTKSNRMLRLNDGDVIFGQANNSKKWIMHTRQSNGSDFLYLTSDDANGNWQWTKGITLMRNTGFIGIGTTPTSPLQVYGVQDVNGVNTRLTSASNHQFSFVLNAGNSGFNWLTKAGDNAIIWDDPNSHGNPLTIRNGLVIAPHTNSSFGIRLDGPTRSVGINTGDPKSTLDVSGSFGAKMSVVNSPAYTLGEEAFIFIANTGDPCNLTFPSAASAKNRAYIISHNFNVSFQSSSLISVGAENAGSSVGFSPAFTPCIVVSDGTRWITMKVQGI